MHRDDYIGSLIKKYLKLYVINENSLFGGNDSLKVNMTGMNKMIDAEKRIKKLENKVFPEIILAKFFLIKLPAFCFFTKTLK